MLRAQSHVQHSRFQMSPDKSKNIGNLGFTTKLQYPASAGEKNGFYKMVAHEPGSSKNACMKSSKKWWCTGCLYKMVMHTHPGWCDLSASWQDSSLIAIQKWSQTVHEHYHFLEEIPTPIIYLYLYLSICLSVHLYTQIHTCMCVCSI